jgi:hypothetical protein
MRQVELPLVATLISLAAWDIQAVVEGTCMVLQVLKVLHLGKVMVLVAEPAIPQSHLARDRAE